jgi:hypothetical protein
MEGGAYGTNDEAVPSDSKAERIPISLNYVRSEYP